jgi:hypothetical protein
MAIVNRKNAVLGWAVWEAVKFTARQKARSAARNAVPSVDLQSKRPNKPAVVAAIVTAAGVALLVRKVTASSNGHAPPPEE